MIVSEVGTRTGYANFYQPQYKVRTAGFVEKYDKVVEKIKQNWV